jgi:hypothetical protein
MLEVRNDVGALEDVGCRDDVGGWWDSTLGVVQDLGRGALQLRREKQALRSGAKLNELSTMWNPGKVQDVPRTGGGGGSLVWLLAIGAAAYVLVRR